MMLPDLFRGYTYAIEKYIPEVHQLEPPEPELYSNEDAHILAAVKDKFGSIEKESAVLSYSVNTSNTWQNESMELMNGTLADGIFSGRIPAQDGNTNVKYKMYFKDDLGYSVTYQDETLTYNVTSQKDETAPSIYVDTENNAYSDEYVEVQAVIEDETGVKNATLSYSIGANQPKKVVPMELQVGGENTYLATIPPVGDNNKNTSVYYHVKAYDRAGLPGIYPGNYTVTEQPRQYSNVVDIRTRVKELDVRSLNSKIEITVEASNISKSSVQQEIPIFVTNADVNNTGETFAIQPMLEPLLPSNSTVRIVNSTLANATISLFGNPAPFPFDRYHLNLVVAIPINEAQTRDIVKFDQIINATWNPNYQTRKLSNNSTFIKNLCSNIDQYRDHAICSRPDFIFENIKLTFERNFTIHALIIPLLAIFFLLGSIFILKSLSEELSNRLTLTLGIFAFIFTINPIIDQIKPSIINVPSIADFLITVLIVATISFSVSSVTGSMRGSKWVDIAMFLFISALIISYGLVAKISVHWIFPVILLGLGYGFLLRIPWRKVFRKHSTVNPSQKL